MCSLSGLGVVGRWAPGQGHRRRGHAVLLFTVCGVILLVEDPSRCEVSDRRLTGGAPPVETTDRSAGGECRAAPHPVPPAGWRTMRTLMITADDGFEITAQVSGRPDGPTLLLLAGQA